jgi:hypothetical protein
MKERARGGLSGAYKINNYTNHGGVSKVDRSELNGGLSRTNERWSHRE